MSETISVTTEMTVEEAAEFVDYFAEPEGYWMTGPYKIAARVANETKKVLDARPKPPEVGDIVLIEGYDASWWETADTTDTWEGHVGRVNAIRSSGDVSVFMLTGELKGGCGAFDARYLKVIGKAVEGN